MILAADTLPDNGGYVAAAYLVFLALLLVYFVIMAVRLGRVERELVELNEEHEAQVEQPERVAS
jgi:hypothetical protein